MTWRQMSAFLHIADMRKTREKMELATVIRMAMNGSPKQFRDAMEAMAKHAEIQLTWDD
jgi:hypothetical protein